MYVNYNFLKRSMSCIVYFMF
uniref:Uncharacterized protein n=1 Tax=Arundo donax TaxID=35708 RepID=A0A0A9HLU3_ARUDO